MRSPANLGFRKENPAKSGIGIQDEKLDNIREKKEWRKEKLGNIKKLAKKSNLVKPPMPLRSKSPRSTRPKLAQKRD